MPARLVSSSLSELLRSLESGRGNGWHLVAGRIYDGLPLGAHPLPRQLLPRLIESEREVVLARVDVEETMPYARPLFHRTDLGRDFYFGDDTGRALVKVGDGGHVHPDVELHLDGVSARPDDDGDDDDDGHGDDDDDGARRAIYVRTIRTGDPVYVWGRASLQRDPTHAGYRDAPVEIVFSPALASGLGGAPLHIYDEAAFRQLSAWRALPWYRKLSVMVRNR